VFQYWQVAPLALYSRNIHVWAWPPASIGTDSQAMNN
jgi:hypothetical protein